MRDFQNLDMPEKGKLTPISYSIKDAARVMSVSERTVWNLVRAGELPSVRIGTRVLILRRSIEEFLETRVDRTGSLVRPDLSAIRKAKTLAPASSEER